MRPRIAWTPEGRAALTREAGESGDCRALVAAGGDGTVSALVNERPDVPIAALASGTENLFARYFGLGGSPEKLAEAIVRGTVARVDLGRIRNRRFALMAGFGFEADVIARHHFGRWGRLGPMHRAAYVAPVLSASAGYTFPSIAVTLDEPADGGPAEVLHGTMAMVMNLPRYALNLRLAPARVDDGRLDVVVFRDAGPLRMLRYLWMVLRGVHLSHEGVRHRAVRRLTVRTEGPAAVPVQLDGDPAGRLEPGRTWEIDVLPAAIDVIVSAPPEAGESVRHRPH